MRITSLILLLVLTISVSCKRRFIPPHTDMSTTIQVDSLFVKEVKKSSLQRQLRYNLDSLTLSSLKPMNGEFFKLWLDGCLVNNMEHRLKFNEDYAYYFWDCKDSDKKFLFSIISDNQNAEREVLHFTIDKATYEITQADLITNMVKTDNKNTGGILRYNPAGDVLGVSSSSSSVETTDNGHIKQSETSVLKFEFGTDETKFTELSSSVKKDTVRSK